ncbi:MAG: UDP-N-acetylglucosamine 2-epimerase, partial [Syntrophales bacterium]|nr:UDP-N-acetylglucosamine 2-epimerase [Syntrophales bacterium]
GLDNFRKLNLLDRKAFEKAIDFDLGDRSFLVTYHPVTLNGESPEKPLNELLSALDHFAEAKIIITKANADSAGRLINGKIEAYAQRQASRVKVFTAMGSLLYLSAIRNTDMVIGNSSSGLLEAPVLQKPTINIGDRQKGRLRSPSVIDCEEEESAIVKAIEKGLSPDFQAILEEMDSLYGQGGASLKIKEYLKNVSLSEVLRKHFYDLDYDA